MIKRIGYAVLLAWRHRKALKKYCQNPLWQRSSVLDIDPSKLKLSGVAVLAIDFDGVLGPYAAESLSPEIVTWLNSCVDVFSKEKVFILTNKPALGRLAYFSQAFNGLVVVSPKQKKPYPDGILGILQLTKVNPEQLLVIDDRLLTGILAAIIAKTSAIYITKPFIALANRPLNELFFISLRALERLLFSFSG